MTLAEDGERMTFSRGRVVVAELRRAGWLEWLEGWARTGRAGQPAASSLLAVLQPRTST
ncbi:hypothetical protein [Streptomyces sp. NPDC059862]|uniref:hypothetical protein n=1 Tax=unclassified Streptomyces TaxID=2593676 RepID=UPI003625F473